MRTQRIYALADPLDGRVRYVGVTQAKLATRLRQHLAFARNGSHFPVYRWIRKLSTCGQAPVMILLEECQDRQRECFWIQHYRRQRAVLLNCTDGGEGLPNPSAETRYKIGGKNRGKTFSPEWRAALSAAHVGRPLPAEQRARIGAAARGKKLSPQARDRIAAAQRGQKRPPSIYPRPQKPVSAPKIRHRKLTAGEVAEVRRLRRETTMTVTELAGRFDQSRGTVQRILQQPPAIPAPDRFSPQMRARLAQTQRARPSRGLLSHGDVRTIRRQYHEGTVTQKKLAEQFGVSPRAIGCVVSGRTWSHVE